MGIAVSGVWKRYHLRSRSLKEALSSLMPRRRGSPPPRPKSMWALEDVSFTVEPSSTFALVGANGSGKSTMLKIIAGMMKATRGSVRVNGRLSLLSFLGGSFHGDLTGRENVFLEGALLGLSRRELRTKLDAIFAFAELERFIDVPVKFYSSGMALRLGFAIAAHLEPEVLLIDEAFAVGDTAFRDRCLGRKLAFKAAGPMKRFRRTSASSKRKKRTTPTIARASRPAPRSISNPWSWRAAAAVPNRSAVPRAGSSRGSICVRV